MRPFRPANILLVEDSPTDRLLAVEALERAKLANNLNIVEDGVEAMDYLRRRGKYAGATRPDLILLDLNLPRKDGREILAEIKTDPVLKFIPVIVLTTSSADEDVARAYGNHANSYITKPVDFPRFTEAIASLKNYWFEVVTLPNPNSISPSAAVPTPRPRAAQESGHVQALLVEDSPTDALLLRDAIADTQLFTVELTECQSLAQAQALIAKNNYDVILTDLGLPDSQGIETYRQLRACSASTAIILLTGLDDETVAVTALREGAQDYLVKGQVTQRALARAVRHAIEKISIQEQLRQSQRMDAIGQLAGGIAHDFNNILTIIQAHASLIAATSPGSDACESALEIGEAVDRAASLTRQLLTFSRQQLIKLEQVNLNDIVGNFTKMLRRVLGANVRLVLSLDKVGPTTQADTGMLEQIILNLAVNARDAMPEGGEIEMTTSSATIAPGDTHKYGREAYPGRFACLTVRDTGAGIAPDHLLQIWEPFFSTKDVGKGTGLGLATVYGIAQQHRGWIDVESQLGKGSTFRVYLPLIEAAELPKVESKSAPLPVTGTETILLVEDESALRRVATRAFESRGYRVISAESGVEALQLWISYRDDIDLLLTDMVMPLTITGRELATRLLQDRPDLKVIYMSGYSTDLIDSTIELREGENFLGKPFAIQKLLEVVRKEAG